MANSTLTLQLVFDTDSTEFAAFGRFLPDLVQPGLRSQVWFEEIDGQTRIFPDKPAVQIKTAWNDPNTPEVGIRVIAALPNGVEWDPNASFALQITAVFGRARTADPKQRYASPFKLSGHDVVGTIFQESFPAPKPGDDAPTIFMGKAVFPAGSTSNPMHHYFFNVSALANLKIGNQTRPLTLSYGHDPEMDVGS